MDNKRIIEDRLREAACVGDVENVQRILSLGVDVNARHPLNGWTPLHWACKRGHLDIVALLLRHGADRDVKSDIGDTPASLCNDKQIRQLLDTFGSAQSLESSLHDSSVYATNDCLHSGMDSNYLKTIRNNCSQDELVLKVRVANSPDPDFIEVELPHSNLTYQALIDVCCKELGLKPTQIQKLRKLPNTKLRKDKDVQRLQNFQEIEVVPDAVISYVYKQSSNGMSNSMPTIPANGYQSISKKDQTILY